MLGLPSGTVRLCPPSHRWQAAFAAERRRLARYAPSRRYDLEHIGSTAVPGLEAKPIIDMALCIPSLRSLSAWIRNLTAAGYVYRGEYGLPGRHFFVRGEPVTHHLHLVEQGCPHWTQWLMFRDYLRTHPKDAQRYRDLKKRLAARYAHDRDAYTRSKTTFVTRLLARAEKASHHPDSP